MALFRFSMSRLLVVVALAPLPIFLFKFGGMFVVLAVLLGLPCWGSLIGLLVDRNGAATAGFVLWYSLSGLLIITAILVAVLILVR